MARARDEMMEELRRMRATNIVISTNVATYRKAGRDIPYANQSTLDNDPGAAVYFTWNDEQYSLACDQWKSLGDNIQAIRKTIEAIRGIARWGTGEMMKAAFAGFKELPAAATSSRPWWAVFGWYSADFTQEQIDTQYRLLRSQRHPDKGGSHEAFIELQQAYEAAKKQFS